MNSPILNATGLHKSYVLGHEPLRVLRGATLRAEAGEFVAVTGASGSGKSTLLHLLGALDVPDRGTVSFQGQDIFSLSDDARRYYRNREVGFVFQFYHLLPECNVLENVVLPQLVGHSVWAWRTARKAAHRRAEALIERVGLSERVRHRPNQLSGGERQRVAVARALATDPALLLADEPTGNLDQGAGKEIMQLLTEFNREGQTIILVTHDPAVARCAHRAVQLREGVIKHVPAPPTGPANARLATKEVTP